MRAFAIAATFLPAAMASLPTTITLWAYSGDRIGCINNRGNLVNNNIFCYPFRAFAVAGTDASKLSVAGTYTCSLNTDNSLNCYPGNGDNVPLFTLSGNNLLTSTGETGSNFSVSSLPVQGDTIGVPLFLGSSGSIPVELQVTSTPGK